MRLNATQKALEYWLLRFFKGPESNTQLIFYGSDT